MICLNIIKDVLEIIYFILAGPVLAYIAFRGLNQIKEARRASQINSTREAFKLAADQCAVFAEKIIPMCENFERELKNSDIKFFDNFSVSMFNDRLELTPVGVIGPEEFEKLNTIAKFTYPMLNALEGYAIYFASGVASENIGYLTTAKSYCTIVKKVMPTILKHYKDGYFKNIIALFIIWNTRLEKEQLELQKKEIEKKLQSSASITIPIIK